MTYELAQQVPLLKDKDGTYIGLGDVVYAEDGTAYDIIGLGREFVWGHKAGSKIDKRLKPEWLTSKRPDSWEQLEKDLLAHPHQCGLSTATGLDCHQFDSCLVCSRERVKALIRRAKALAAKEEA